MFKKNVLVDLKLIPQRRPDIFSGGYFFFNLSSQIFKKNFSLEEHEYIYFKLADR